MILIGAAVLGASVAGAVTPPPTYPPPTATIYLPMVQRRSWYGGCTVTARDRGSLYDTTKVFEYGAAGQLLLRLEDVYADGVWDERETRTYNAAGDLDVIEIEDLVEDTSDRYVHEYSPRRQLVAYHHDYEADGVIDFSRVYSYTADGRLASEAVDLHDGRPLQVTERYWYDPGWGWRVYGESERDGVPIAYSVYTWEDGLLQRLDFFDLPDEELGLYFVYDYYPDGKLKEYRVFDADVHEPGEFVLWAAFKYWYDEAGRLLQTDWLASGGTRGTHLESREEYVYDRRGRVVEEHYSGGCCGVGAITYEFECASPDG